LARGRTKQRTAAVQHRRLALAAAQRNNPNALI